MKLNYFTQVSLIINITPQHPDALVKFCQFLYLSQTVAPHNSNADKPTCHSALRVQLSSLTVTRVLVAAATVHILHVPGCKEDQGLRGINANMF
jgi:hypothetical protein